MTPAQISLLETLINKTTIARQDRVVRLSPLRHLSHAGRRQFKSVARTANNGSKNSFSPVSARGTLCAGTMPPDSMSAIKQSRKLRILGVDPAVTGATGYGVIEIDGSAARPMRFGALRLPSRATFAVRLREIHFLISGLVEQLPLDAVAVESVFTALNMHTALEARRNARRCPARRRPGADSGAQLFPPRSESQRGRFRRSLQAADTADGAIASRSTRLS